MSETLDGLFVGFLDTGGIAFDPVRQAVFGLEGATAVTVAACLDGVDPSELAAAGLLESSDQGWAVLDDLAARRAATPVATEHSRGAFVRSSCPECGFLVGPIHLAVRGDAVLWQALGETIGQPPRAAVPEALLEFTFASTGGVQVNVNGAPFLTDPIASDYVPTVARAAAIAAAVDVLDETLDLHAAAVDLAGRDVVILGDAESGKSNLAAALSARDGAALMAEDVLLLNFDGPLSFDPLGLPVSLKKGAWPMFTSYGGDVQRSEVFTRMDGQEVRYLQVKNPAQPRTARVKPLFVHVGIDRDKPAHLSTCSGYFTACEISRQLITPSKMDAKTFYRLVDWVRKGEHVVLTHPGGWAGRDALVAHLKQSYGSQALDANS